MGIYFDKPIKDNMLYSTRQIVGCSGIYFAGCMDAVD
jgi:hypothetical protein